MNILNDFADVIEISSEKGRYKDWFIEISQERNEPCLEVLEELCDFIFEKYKIFEDEREVKPNSEKLELSYKYFLIGHTLKRKRELTLKNDIKTFLLSI